MDSLGTEAIGVGSTLVFGVAGILVFRAENLPVVVASACTLALTAVFAALAYQLVRWTIDQK